MLFYNNTVFKSSDKIYKAPWKLQKLLKLFEAFISSFQKL